MRSGTIIFRVSQTSLVEFLFVMPRLLVPNFNFESELTGQANSESLTSRVTRQSIAPLMGLLANEGDCVLVDDNATPGLPLPPCLQQARYLSESDLRSAEENFTVVPWGWSNQIRQFANRFHCTMDSPPSDEVVRMLNSRLFMAEYDRVVPLDQAGSDSEASFLGCVCDSLESVLSALKQFHEEGYSRWIVKPDLSHAGRNRLAGQSANLNFSQRRWVEKQVDNFQRVYAEPRVQIEREHSLQFDIQQNGDSGKPISLVGITELLNTSRGEYAGSIVRPGIFNEASATDSASERSRSNIQPAVQVGMDIATKAAELGYSGPLGIDCMSFRAMDGRLMLRVVNDINARYTMGRLALQHRAALSDNEWGIWCIRSSKFRERTDQPWKTVVEKYTRDVDIIPTSPQMLSGQPATIDTCLVITNSMEIASEFRQLITSPD